MSSLRLPCPDCNDKASVQLFHDGGFCHACRLQSKHRSLIKPVIKIVSKTLRDFSSKIPESGVNWLKKYRVTEEQITRYKIGWSEEFQRLVFPYYREGEYEDSYQYAWLRDVTGIKIPKWLYIGPKKKLPFLLDDPHRGHTSLVITEDVVSAIRCSQVRDSLALGGLNFKDFYLSQVFLQYDELVVWLDGDNAGRNAAIRFKKQYHFLRPIRLIKQKQDPKEFSFKQIEEILK